MGTRYYFTAEVAEKILSGEELVSLDLNISKTIVRKVGDKYYLPNGDAIEKEDLEYIAKRKGHVFMYEDGIFYDLVVREPSFYKLVPTEKAPTVEINGIRMHRTKDLDPWEDAKRKVSQIKVRGTVLDTCMGLGYTAIWARKLGASTVISVEKDENIIFLASLNPWSSEVFNDPNINVIKGDVFYVVQYIRDETIDAIIHDPPRISLAGELYSAEFYRELYRILKPGGFLYHYVGRPGARYRGKNYIRGVMLRLSRSGFIVRKTEDGTGVIARKPTRKQLKRIEKELKRMGVLENE
ncbi:MAG: methyltransferase domain-containing protein [Euryarchaeota archaeon]|nr:methyltransferase domain-containing protein [Euryarchaeota archaeon]